MMNDKNDDDNDDKEEEETQACPTRWVENQTMTAVTKAMTVIISSALAELS
jgi:hypothetical protein